MKHAFSRMILTIIRLLAYVLSTCVKTSMSVIGQSHMIEYHEGSTSDGIKIHTFRIYDCRKSETVNGKRR